MSGISQFKKLRVLVLNALTSAPDYVVSADAQGNFGKLDFEKLRYRNIDGGSASSVYLPTQNIEGGASATAAYGTIDGGDA
ncbi:hypothetical protein [Aestuariibaculum marinum]|uniref:Uncharacterized protein n=1 Tax=Aestuariibaculum marinum TaxID=2683592 RepID=A0A8J6Q043_9FLAO|nr:hypothetical protein [Aestuariibaculum marinum]MBD0822654.1 hypothetical protein [Aestuariibaculum marinum]